MSTLVQCEFCDIFVDFDEYLNHVRECSENISALTSSISSYLTYSISSYNSNSDSTINESDFETNNIANVNQELEDEDEDQYLDENGASISANNQYQPHTAILNLLNNLGIATGNGNIVTAVINLENINRRNIYDTYNMYSNLEDVKVTVKNIDQVAPIIKESDISEGTICTICQDPVKSPARKTLCEHCFCTSCIEPWLNEMNKTCPNCLTDLEELNKTNKKDDKND
jgi:hypothetical protein